MIVSIFYVDKKATALSRILNRCRCLIPGRSTARLTMRQVYTYATVRDVRLMHLKNQKL